MFDPTVELAENRKLDELLQILKQNNDEEEQEGDDDSDESSDDDRDYESQLSQDEDEIIVEPSTWTTPTCSTSTSALQSSDSAEILKHITTLPNLMSHISFEEFDVITDCKDPQLKTLLVLNRAKHVQLKMLINKYNSLLADIESSIRNHCANRETNVLMVKCSNKINRVAFPYFNVNRFAPPNNADFYAKKQNNEVNLIYYFYRTKLTKMSVKKMRTCLIFNYYMNSMQLIDDKMSALKRSLIDCSSYTASERNDIDLEIDRYEAKMLQMQQDMKDGVENMLRECPDLWDDALVSWDDIAERDFKDVTLAQSLRAMWNYYLHPKINDSRFTKDENKKIMDLVKLSSPSTPDWSSMAIELGTNRSEHQLCTHYMSVLDDSHIETELDVDDDKLFEQIDNARMIPSWNNLSYRRSNTKCRSQLYHRFKYQKSMENQKVGKYTMEEDMKIINLTQKYGLDYEQISKEMQRTKGQIKYRYEHNLACENLQYGNWRVEEDEMIAQHVNEHGEGNWFQLVGKMNRHAAQIRHRFNIIKKHLLMNPDGDISTIPRRKHRYSELIKKKRQIVAHAAHITEHPGAEPLLTVRSAIDAQLVDFFAPTAQLKKTRAMRQIKEEQLRASAATVRKVLDCFRVKLAIPETLDEFGLDSIDHELLNILRTDRNDVVAVDENDGFLFPPNLSSTQSLRYLLLQSYNANATQAKAAAVRKRAGDERESVRKFIDRFKMFFMWPSLMSIVEPPVPVPAEELDPQPTPSTSTSETLPVEKNKRNVGRPKKDNSKIMKMAAALREKKRLAEQLAATAKTKVEPDKVDNQQQLVKINIVNVSIAHQQIDQPNANQVNKPVVLMKVVDKATIQRIKERNRKVVPIQVATEAKQGPDEAQHELVKNADSSASSRLRKRKMSAEIDEPTVNRAKLPKQYTKRAKPMKELVVVIE